MVAQDIFEHSVAALHEAALDDRHWSQAMALIEDACGLAGVHLVLFAGNLSTSGCQFQIFHHSEGSLQDLARHYMEDYFPRDERIPRMFRLPPGRLTHNTELYTEQEQKTSVTYNEFLCRYNGQNQLAVRLGKEGEGRVLLWVVTRLSKQGAWHAAHLALLNDLMPHIRHAVRVRHALVSAEAQQTALAGLLDMRSLGTLFLDHRGRIREANDRARELLHPGSGLSEQDGVLRARSAADNAQLWKLLAHALRGRPAAGGSMTVKQSSGLPPLVLHVSPVASRRAAFDIGGTSAFVLLVDPQTTPRIDAALVASAFGLTPAESQVAASLAAGDTLRAIAARTHRAESTVRWLLKQCYAKLGVRRQADLVRLVLSLAGVGHP